MDKKSISKPDVLREIRLRRDEGIFTGATALTLESFYKTYRDAVADRSLATSIFARFLDQIVLQCKTPYPFQLFHKSVRAPFDYYSFGLEFLRPLVIYGESSLRGTDNLDKIETQLRSGDNVVFLANHQIEPDPIVISLMLEKDYPLLAREMIFVAGERVLTDPLAAPFSMGCNLLCIYSKRYIDTPPEKKVEKQLHNKKTMQLMSQLLKEGGKCIYVAPSGGRDRKNAGGVVEIAPFDGQSIEMFYLMAKQSKKKTHFYPMALDTYHLMPPPETVQYELGEMRVAARVPIHLAIGAEVDMDHFPGSELDNKHLRRKSRANYIWDYVRQEYQRFSQDI